jgi:uncharacterized protein (DUF1015 family)
MMGEFDSSTASIDKGTNPMADIRPFCAWRYNSDVCREIDELTSPLFDVASEKQRAALYRNPYNSIHLSIPQGNHPARTAAQTLQQWKEEGCLKQDAVPGIYVYCQYFNLPGDPKRYCRKGFVCQIRICQWDENIVLRHENIKRKSVRDQVDLLEATRLNICPTHGLYSDPSFELETHMDDSMALPIYEVEDYQGVRDVLSVIRDSEAIRCFVDCMRDKHVILADGHHRYAASLLYMKQQRALNPAHTGDEGYNFHLIWLTNCEAQDLRILPTHRLIKGLPDFDEAAIMKRFERNFVVKPVAESADIPDVIRGHPWSFGVLFRENAYSVRLKAEVFFNLKWRFPMEIKELDLTVMHYFIIEDILGIPGKDQADSDNLEYERNFSTAITKLLNQQVQMAIVVNETSIEDIKRVCGSGCTMPPKSTFFYPKVVCGFLFGEV